MRMPLVHVHVHVHVACGMCMCACSAHILTQRTLHRAHVHTHVHTCTRAHTGAHVRACTRIRQLRVHVVERSHVRLCVHVCVCASSAGPPFSTLYLMPKSSSGPPGLCDAVSSTPPNATPPSRSPRHAPAGQVERSPCPPQCFDGVIGREIQPGAHLQTDAELDTFLVEAR